MVQNRLYHGRNGEKGRHNQTITEFVTDFSKPGFIWIPYAGRVNWKFWKIAGWDERFGEFVFGETPLGMGLSRVHSSPRLSKLETSRTKCPLTYMAGIKFDHEYLGDSDIYEGLTEIKLDERRKNYKGDSWEVSVSVGRVNPFHKDWRFLENRITSNDFRAIIIRDPDKRYAFLGNNRLILLLDEDREARLTHGGHDLDERAERVFYNGTIEEMIAELREGIWKMGDYDGN